jgi:hypothetical protein
MGLLVAALPVAAVAKPKAVAKVTQVLTPLTLPPAPALDEGDASASCPGGTTLIGGGSLANTPTPGGPPVPDLDLFKSGPSGNSWNVRYDNDAELQLQPAAQAICLKSRLKVSGADGKPKAVSKVVQVSTPFTLPSSAVNNGLGSFDVACPSGTTIASGGASFPATVLDVTDIRLEESAPRGNAWHVRYDNDEPTDQPAVASALCLKRKLKLKNGEGKQTARSRIEQVDQVVQLPQDETNSGRARFTVACPRGTTPVGGGISRPSPSDQVSVQIEESGAVGDGWQVLMDNDAGLAPATVYAMCLKTRLKVR